MNLLFTEKQTFIDRLNKLTPQTQALWGKMNVAQMMAHCGEGFKSSLGEVPMAKRAFLGYIFGSFAKKQIMSDKPFGKNMPTAPELKITTEKEFDTEKTKLLALIDRVCKAGYQGISTSPHPFFGKMTPQEWEALFSKHLDHHLNQFGV